MPAAEQLITDHLDLWTAAIKRKSTAGRGSSSKIELYGIKKLRELILELAVRGLLVPQDPNEEPASKLLLRIAAEKAKLIAEEKIKKEKPLLPIAEDEKPFEVPSGWALSRLGVTGRYINGLAFKPEDWGNEGLPIIRIQNLSGRNAEFNFTTRKVGEDLIVTPGEMLVSWSATLDVFIWNNESRGVLNQHIFRVAPFSPLDDRFLFWLLKHSIQRLADSDHAHGLVMSHINRGDFLGLPVVLPPLPEQHRIVTKVDELMALCDQLEQQTYASGISHQALVKTLLNVLTSVADHTQFATAWQRIVEHFDTLFTSEESIAQLKQTILQLAVMGKLVPQDSNDEPASELFKKIAAEKAKLVKDGKIKKAKLLPPILEKEKPFALPAGWEWCRLSQATEGEREISYGIIKLEAEPASGGVPTLRCSDVKPGYIQTLGVRTVAPEIEEPYKRTRLRGGEVLVNIRGTLGGAALVPVELAGCNIAREVAMVPIHSSIEGRYIVCTILSPFFWGMIESNLKGIAYKGLSLELLSQFAVPIPPVSEQHRIVAKVDELMALCDQLRSLLAAAQASQLHLADSMAEQALAEA